MPRREVKQGRDEGVLGNAVQNQSSDGQISLHRDELLTDLGGISK